MGTMISSPSLFSMNMQNAIMKNSISMVEDLIESCPEGEFETSFLRLSSTYGNAKITKLLLSKGISASSDGSYAMYTAVEKKKHDIAKLLLTHGADPNCREALNKACENDDRTMVRMLMTYGADVRHKNDEAILRFCKSIEVFELLAVRYSVRELEQIFSKKEDFIDRSLFKKFLIKKKMKESFK